MTWLLLILLVASEAEPRIVFQDGRGRIEVRDLASERECKRLAAYMLGEMERSGFRVTTDCRSNS